MADIEKGETPRLISADKVKGTEVYNASGDKLGTVEEIMIDKRSGKVAYAVMSFGGFLGIGEEYHPLPWSMLSYDPSEDGYSVNLTKEQLDGAPRMSPDTEFDFTAPAVNKRIHNYYGVPFVWP